MFIDVENVTLTCDIIIICNLHLQLRRLMHVNRYSRMSRCGVSILIGLENVTDLDDCMYGQVVIC